MKVERRVACDGRSRLRYPPGIFFPLPFPFPTLFSDKRDYPNGYPLLVAPIPPQRAFEPYPPKRESSFPSPDRIYFPSLPVFFVLREIIDPPPA